MNGLTRKKMCKSDRSAGVKVGVTEQIIYLHSHRLAVFASTRFLPSRVSHSYNDANTDTGQGLPSCLSVLMSDDAR